MTIRRIFRKAQIASAALLICGAMAFAHPSRSFAEQTAPAPITSKLTNPDKKFVRKAWEGGIAEVQMGHLAANKAHNEQVKEFGQKMVDLYTNLGDRLRPIAGQLGLGARSTITAKDRALLTKLQEQNGQQFVQTYVQAMVKRQHQNLAEFRKESQTAQDPAVKEFAAHGAQVIAEHASLVQKLAKLHPNAPGGQQTKTGTPASSSTSNP